MYHTALLFCKRGGIHRDVEEEERNRIAQIVDCCANWPPRHIYCPPLASISGATGASTTLLQRLTFSDRNESQGSPPHHRKRSRKVDRRLFFFLLLFVSFPLLFSLSLFLDHTRIKITTSHAPMARRLRVWLFISQTMLCSLPRMRIRKKPVLDGIKIRGQGRVFASIIRPRSLARLLACLLSCLLACLLAGFASTWILTWYRIRFSRFI